MLSGSVAPQIKINVADLLSFRGKTFSGDDDIELQKVDETNVQV